MPFLFCFQARQNEFYYGIYNPANASKEPKVC